MEEKESEEAGEESREAWCEVWQQGSAALYYLLLLLGALKADLSSAYQPAVWLAAPLLNGERDGRKWDESSCNDPR